MNLNSIIAQRAESIVGLRPKELPPTIQPNVTVEVPPESIKVAVEQATTEPVVVNVDVKLEPQPRKVNVIRDNDGKIVSLEII